jgi:ribosomal protein S16
MFCCIAIFAIMTVVSVPSHARGDKVKKLNKDNVKAFITDTSQMTKGGDEFTSTESISIYLEKHLAKDARFISTMTYHLPNMQPQSTSVNFDKDQFMQTVNEGAESIESYENTVKITDIKIAWGGKKAFVKTESIETGFMPVPSDAAGNLEDVPIEGTSNCAQVITLHKGVIQMSNAVCKTDITFSEF